MGVLRVPVSPLAEGSFELPRETARYVLRVHRLSAGDTFLAFDPTSAREADAKVTSASRDAATVLVGPTRAARLLPTREVTIIQGVAKGDKLDAVVRDATELGATVIVVAMTARSVVDHKSDAALARWGRVAVEAARQCGRGDLPRIEAPRPLSEIVSALDATLKVVMVPGAERALGPILATSKSTSSLAILIGPEGGLEPSEIAAAEATGFVAASLGRFVLRTETACAAALGAALAFGDPA